MDRRELLALGCLAAVTPWARAHHGWSSFDQGRPIYLEGTVQKVAWRNPHVEFDLKLAANPTLPADLAQRAVPAQSATVDGAGILKAAVLPTRRDAVWQIELAPLTRVEAWKLPQIKVGDALALVGFTFHAEKGEPLLRVEYLFAGGKTYGMRSSPV